MRLIKGQAKKSGLPSNFFETIPSLPKKVPVSASYYYGRNAKGCPLAWHEAMEIQFIKGGEGAYFIAGIKYPFGKNSLLIIKPKEIHRLLPHSDSLVEKWGILFKPECCADVKVKVDLLIGYGHHVRLKDEEAAVLDRICSQIAGETRKKNIYYEELLKTKLSELLVWVKRAFACSSPSLMEHPLVSKVVLYIDHNFYRPLTIPLLTEVTGCSARHLARLFRRCVGMSIKRYILHRRILEAQTLLREQPFLKTTAVAESVGFCQYSDFHRMFKTTTGTTPGQYVRISEAYGRNSN